MYDDKINKIIKNTTGQIVIKEYPTASAHSGHFRGLIKELAVKKSFKPDIIFIDYLNICASSRFKGQSMSTLTCISSRLQKNLGDWQLRQTSRLCRYTDHKDGFSNTDIGLEDTVRIFWSSCYSTYVCVISSEELEERNQIAVKQLKNRYNDPTMNKRFVIGIDRAKMRLHDLEESEQQGLVDSNQKEDTFNEPVFDKTDFGEGCKFEYH